MPTISEPLWPEQDDKINAIVADFINGVDTEGVFKARLFGTGLRGQDLTSIYNVTMDAVIEKGLARVARYEPRKVLVMERGGATRTINFKDAHCAANAVELLRRQPNVLFAARVVN